MYCTKRFKYAKSQQLHADTPPDTPSRRDIRFVRTSKQEALNVAVAAVLAVYLFFYVCLRYSLHFRNFRLLYMLFHVKAIFCV